MVERGGESFWHAGRSGERFLEFPNTYFENNALILNQLCVTRTGVFGHDHARLSAGETAQTTGRSKPRLREDSGTVWPAARREGVCGEERRERFDADQVRAGEDAMAIVTRL
jgi:hypothetical protein